MVKVRFVLTGLWSDLIEVNHGCSSKIVYVIEWVMCKLMLGFVTDYLDEQKNSVIILTHFNLNAGFVYSKTQ